MLPHRAPILRLHRVVAADASAAIVLGSEPEGPGALPWELGAIEGLAQSAAVLLGQSSETAGPRPSPRAGGPRGMLVALKRFVIEAQPPRGAEITYHVHLVRRLGPTAMVAGHAECEGVRLAGGELTLWTAPA
jgi:hypothetical protein